VHTPKQRMGRGFTLVELVCVLAVLGVLVGITVPRLVGGGDRWVVREAREEVVALVYRARMEARRRGEATLEVSEEGSVLVRTASGEVAGRWSPAVPGLRIEIGGARREATLRFGPNGVGRLANATLILRRGREEAEIVISQYGRVRR
jgi:prepilin-type N-terminal cleavage/methylation domain-containing protein